MRIIKRHSYSFILSILTALVCLQVVTSGCRNSSGASPTQGDLALGAGQVRPEGSPLSLVFADTDNGWIVYQKSLWRITDRGTKWELRMALPKKSQLEPNISFHNIFILNSQGLLVNLGSKLLKTTDGGMSWSSILELDHSEYVNDVFVDDSGNGWAVGGRLGTNFVSTPLLFHTTDGGETWQRFNSLPIKKEDMQDWLELYTVRFLQGGAGWISGSGLIWLTRDGGESWKRVGLKIDGYTAIRLKPLQFLDEQHGFANYGPTRGAAPHFLVSTEDGGISWQLLNYPMAKGPLGFGDFHFLDANHGFAIFQDELVETLDGGRHWEKIELAHLSGSPFSPNILFFLDREHGWIAGADGLLISTSDAGKTWQTVHEQL